jgi:hypothetical protein
MKNIFKNTLLGMIFLFGIASILATSPYCGESCRHCSCYPPNYFNADPIYMSYEELRGTGTIKVIAAERVQKAGKIYVSDPYLFINDLNRGIHVYDNSDPKAPKNLGLITIPGNVDIAVKNSILFADSFIDLLAIDLTNFPQIAVSKRIERSFPYNPYQAIDDPNIYLRNVDEKKGVVIGYQKNEKPSKGAGDEDAP